MHTERMIPERITFNIVSHVVCSAFAFARIILCCCCWQGDNDSGTAFVHCWCEFTEALVGRYRNASCLYNASGALQSLSFEHRLRAILFRNYDAGPWARGVRFRWSQTRTRTCPSTQIFKQVEINTQGLTMTGFVQKSKPRAWPWQVLIRNQNPGLDHDKSCLEIKLATFKIYKKTTFFQGCQFVTFKIYTKNQVFSRVSICDIQNIYKKPGFFKGVNLRFSKYIQKTMFFQWYKFVNFKIYTKNQVFAMLGHFLYKKPGFSR